MRLQGLFLGSRVGRRIFWSLLAAAFVPLALFASIGVPAWQEHRRVAEQRADNTFLKHAGLRAFDRLLALRNLLAVHAVDGDWRQPDRLRPAPRQPLVRVATLRDDGSPVAGDAALADAWRRAHGDALSRLRWLPATGAAPARVLLAHRDEAERGWWVAEVAADYLWEDFGADGAAAGVCVVDPLGRPLHCPPAGSAPAAATPPAPSGRPPHEWRLFLSAEFGSTDWRLVGRAAGADEAGDERLPRLVALGIVGTLVLIAALGMVLVRRTVEPLEQLAEGTRRLAGGDWQARVPLSPPGRRARADEFGQLATAFNAMAAHLAGQMQAMAVHAAIDRQILDGDASAAVLARVAQRLLAIVPATQVRIAARDAAARRWQLHGPAGASAQAVQPGDEALRPPPDGLACHWPAPAQPAWLRDAFAGGADASGGFTSVVSAHWQGELVALLLFATPHEPAWTAAQRREIGDLRDRVAVALAAATREHHLVERARRDGLTGLLNRNGLADACDAQLAAPQQPGQVTAFLFIDLDGFKEVNDTLGHALGDELLRAVAGRLRACVPAAATLARPGGDEFVVVVPATPAEAEALAAELCRQAALPFHVRGQALHLGASIGVACHPDDAADREELMRRADLAMYAAKADGRGRWRRYADQLDERASERAWIMRDLRDALDASALAVHFQPRIAARDGHVASVEALVRWTHPTRGAVSPARFVPVAEDCGLIARLGDFVLEASLAQLARWRDEDLPVGRVAVNVSALQLREPTFAARIQDSLQRHRLAPRDLEIEVTESVCAADVAGVRQALEPLRDAGVVVALDDFGTGYSSLGALQQLPVDVLKIDRSFVIDLGQRESAEAIVRSVIALARALGKRVVAEGVETAAQEERLLALGCDEFQGWRYARAEAPGATAQRVRKGFAVGAATPSATASRPSAALTA
ncbi:MAG: EAL domain-containing protein [Betaproteobacteria bacterium]|nr:EAL domain-containing protein [Betaproteobacteria bacterium]